MLFLQEGAWIEHLIELFLVHFLVSVLVPHEQLMLVLELEENEDDGPLP